MKEQEELFEHIASELSSLGYCVVKGALSPEMASALAHVAQTDDRAEYKQASIGRGHDQLTDFNVRSDKIKWIDGQTEAEKDWLAYGEALMQYLNRRLFLGLFSFESHFAHYAPGAFYEKHRDAFHGRSNRILSAVTYLNASWQQEWGGELLIYSDAGTEVIERVSPEMGTLVIFLSEEFPHEVLPATKDRYSIATWFRVNNSANGRVDPPA